MGQVIKFEVKLPAKIIKRRNRFVASCPILDVHSQGQTEEKAKKNLVEALSLFLVSCFDRGVLDEVLKNCGFTVRRGILQQKTPPMKASKFVSVSIPFLVNQGSATECHA